MSAMKRRTFLGGAISAALVPVRNAFGQGSSAAADWAGQPVNLARYGDPKSWLHPEAGKALASGTWLDENAGTSLNLADLGAAGQPEVDLGVEWPEFRTVEKILIRYAGGKAPRHGQQYVEHWSGLTALQGQWKTLEDGSTNAAFVRVDGDTWTYTFAPMRTSKVRLRVVDGRNVAVDQFSVFGPSRWKSGEVRIEVGHLGTDKPLDGSLEFYNAELLELHAVSGAEMRGRDSWAASGGRNPIARLRARILYTYGADVDRSIITVRGANGAVSFLPALAIEDKPIDIPDFGVYVSNEAKPVDRQEFVRGNEGRHRIIDEVGRMPEQTLEKAYANIEARRVTLSFVGVDSNNHKFGIAPDGHIVVGTHDPSAGQVMVPAFSLYFDTTEEPLWFQPPAPNLPATGPQAAAREWQKQQSLAEGWLPILTTAWSQNELGFERTDYAHLHGVSGGQDSWNGDEPAVLISRLRISNTSAISKTGRYYMLPWKPAAGGLSYGPIPANVANGWNVSVQDNIITVQQENASYALCYVDTHGKGTLTPVPALNAVRYSLELGPGETHTIHTVLPGTLRPAAESSKLTGLPYDEMLAATAQYWKDLRARSMQVEVPDQHLQRIFDATQHHFLLAMTKDGKRGEYYPNTAMLHYGSIGSESSPIIQSLDMRGMHDRARDCLKSWLSTQGDLMPAGDYQSKEGGFFRFWPIYTIDQGAVLWALAEHYLYTRDKAWLKEIAPQMVAGCDFIIRERNRTKKMDASGRKPLWYGLAPAGCTADPRDWEYSFMLNAYFYLGMKKSAAVLQDVDQANATRIAGEAADYLAAIRACLRESIALSPVTRLRDNSSVPSVPSYVGLRGFSSDVKDSVDPDRRHGYAYDCTIGPFHLLKGEVLEPGDREVTWMLNALEDRFFLFTPLPSRVNLERISTDWFDLGGFEKLQPYYVHYQDAYLQRDQIPNFLRGFFNTLASISDPHTLTFQEELDFGGAQPHKTHEEGWFFHQVRGMLVVEMGNDLFLARGTPRAWLEHGKQIAATKAPTYFGEVSYRIQSSANSGRIEAVVNPPSRNAPAHVYLRLRHPQKAKIKSVTVAGAAWKHFDPEKEWIEIPAGKGEVLVAASY
jgi:hypothetical protein